MRYQNMRTVYLLLIFMGLTLSSCQKDEFVGFSGMGKAPIYVAASELDDIESQSPQAVEQSGPIFLIGDLFFMTEIGQGIHVFDIEDEDQETSLVFIKIPAITDFTIDGNFLYADSWRDLVTIDISDIYNVVFLSRTEDVFDPFLFPQLYDGPFECIDESKGAVIGWMDKDLVNVLCRTF